MLNSNTLNHLIVSKFILMLNRVISVWLEYLKPFNYIQTNEL